MSTQASWPALGTTASLLVGDPDALDAARAVLAAELERIDQACSRFRDDSDLARVNRAGGRETDVGPAFVEALAVALRVAAATGGAVVPTTGRSLEALGYDRDFAAGLDGRGTAVAVAPAGEVRLDAAAGTVSVSGGARLDLGATAKALAADRAARLAHERTGAAVLVNLGGDIAIAGPAPDSGWRVHVGDDHAAVAGGQVVTLQGGGLATSSTTVRRWRSGGAARHHIVDPATGESCEDVWRTATVAAATCVDANAAATAAIVRGHAAPAWLTERALPSRLVAASGDVTCIAGWPRP